MSSETPAPPADLYPLILDSIDLGVFTVDSDFAITSFNQEAERITGVAREEAIGQRCYHVFRASICESSCALRRTLETGEPLRNVRVDVLNQDMESVPILVTTAVLRDGDGQMRGGVEMFRDISAMERLRKEASGEQGFADIIGTSAAMQEVFRLLPDVAASDATVLVEGPSGSGKELVARAVHTLSPRRDQPFVRINCGALPDTLLESELFGYVKGAFTDARRDKPGRFAQADGGTLLLDEIGDVSPAFGVKLLRVLEESEVQPLGSTETIPVDVRVIGATNRDLAERVRQGLFREDLYYRLRVVPIRLPALRERTSDIPLLVDHFVSLLATKTGKPILGLTPAALDRLVAHEYPGNVRELRNILERAFVLCHDERIDVEHLPRELQPSLPAPASSRPHSDPATPSPRPVNLKPSEIRILGGAPVSRDELSPQARHLVEALDQHGWNRTRTAKALGIGRNTLWRRMREYGLLEPRRGAP